MNMQKLLCAHWLTELINKLIDSPEAHLPQNCMFEKEPEALTELESAHPKISEDQQFVEDLSANELLASSGTQLQYKFNFDSVLEVLNELEFSYPELFEDLKFAEELKPVDEQI